ncbi:PH domain-containing protein [Humibacillus xanthopallidus]|uniref:PH (Pleckstrin Homology) domain-containing protein n=1 Tax=Humibacillus xanthopallidus TaxID=412689 RepID=A0A543I034_9MICO|nr:PH domain-containing protein [Humibacillus xanthopallidus]TQM63949.1 PH (Pleckstrin Homology) domain-containing protein [Humibacillus xanthopallidus]
MGDTSRPKGRTLRPGSSIAVGAIAAVAGLALLVPALLTEPRSWALVSSVTLALVLLWLFVVRPAAVIHDEGIRLVNPMRVVDLTWPTITEVRSKWALELVADGKKYTAWGVPADPGRPKYGRSLLTVPANRMAKAGSVTASGTRPAEEPVKRAKVEAQSVAAEVEALIEADRRRKGDPTPRIAHQSWDPVSVGLLAVALAFFALGIGVL